MEFYSYDYVLSQLSVGNWLVIISLGVLCVASICFSVKYYHHNKDSKYRELVIITLLITVIIGLVQWTRFADNAASDNQYRASLHFIESVSKTLGVDKSEVYVNTSVLTDGAIIKVKDNYYRALGASDAETYVLEKMTLKNPKIKLVEVKK